MNEKRFTPDQIKAILLMTVKENLTENVTVDYTSSVDVYRMTINNYRISVCKKGVTAGAMIIAKKQGIHKLNRMIKAFENYCRDLAKAVHTLDHKAHVTMLILNDANPEHTLLTIIDGTTIYNFMDEKQKGAET